MKFLIPKRSFRNLVDLKLTVTYPFLSEGEAAWVKLHPGPVRSAARALQRWTLGWVHRAGPGGAARHAHPLGHPPLGATLALCPWLSQLCGLPGRRLRQGQLLWTGPAQWHRKLSPRYHGGNQITRNTWAKYILTAQPRSNVHSGQRSQAIWECGSVTWRAIGLRKRHNEGHICGRHYWLHLRAECRQNKPERSKLWHRFLVSEQWETIGVCPRCVLIPPGSCLHHCGECQQSKQPLTHPQHAPPRHPKAGAGRVPDPWPTRKHHAVELTFRPK